VALACALLAASAFNSLLFEAINQAAPRLCWQLRLVLVGGVAPLVGCLENGVLSSQRAVRYGDQRPALFQIAFGIQITCTFSIYSHTPSRIDGHVLEPAHQSIPDPQIEAGDKTQNQRGGCRWTCAPRRERSKSVGNVQIGPPQLQAAPVEGPAGLLARQAVHVFGLYISNQSGSWRRKHLRPGRKPDPGPPGAIC
jgi:hypothetical protein